VRAVDEYIILSGERMAGFQIDINAASRTAVARVSMQFDISGSGGDSTSRTFASIDGDAFVGSMRR
jgi:hypothetical protein